MKYSDCLENCSRVVASWPKWKQKLIGHDSIKAQKGSWIKKDESKENKETEMTRGEGREGMKQYRMTDDEYNELVEACKPLVYIVAGSSELISPEKRAMIVWEKIAARVGCEVITIDSAGTGDEHDFIGVPIQKA